MAGDYFGLDGKVESSTSVVGDILAREVRGDFDRDRYRVVDEHEALQRLIALPIAGARRQRERRHSRGVVFLSRVSLYRVPRGGLSVKPVA